MLTHINKGVSLYFDEKMNLTSFDCSRPAGLKNDDMKYIVFFPETGAVHLSGKDITDSVFYYLQDLKMLTALSLYDTSVNGEGFKYIIDNRELIVFDFGGSPITDSGLKYISQIEFKKHIIILNLKESKITDEGMKSISKMKLGQVRINIQSTQITDKGIEYLFNFKNAIEIDLRNCKISDTGVSRLKKAIPGASIIWGILPPVDQTVY